MNEQSECIYVIGPDDRIVVCDPEWNRRASEGSGGLFFPVELGENVRSSMPDTAVADLYERLVKRARRGHGVDVTFCRGAGARRERFGMHFESSGSNVVGVRLRSIPIEDAVCSRSPFRGLVIVCSWCDGVKPDGDWMEIERAAERFGLFDAESRLSLSHGICPSCYDRNFPGLRRSGPGGEEFPLNESAAESTISSESA